MNLTFTDYGGLPTLVIATPFSRLCQSGIGSSGEAAATAGRMGDSGVLVRGCHYSPSLCLSYGVLALRGILWGNMVSWITVPRTPAVDIAVRRQANQACGIAPTLSRPPDGTRSSDR